MREGVKQFIQDHILLIDRSDWDKLFTLAEPRLIPSAITELKQVLLDARISEPLQTMTFIPTGYYSDMGNISYVTPQHILEIHEGAFSYSDMTSLRITSNIENLSQWSIERCLELEEVTIEEGVIGIYDYAFIECEKLKTVRLPKSLVRLGRCVFGGCSNLTRLHYAGTMEEWSKILVDSDFTEGAVFTSVVCSDGVIRIHYY